MASVVDGDGATVTLVLGEDHYGVRRVAARNMVATAASSASWKGMEERMELPGVGVLRFKLVLVSWAAEQI